MKGKVRIVEEMESLLLGALSIGLKNLSFRRSAVFLLQLNSTQPPGLLTTIIITLACWAIFNSLFSTETVKINRSLQVTLVKASVALQKHLVVWVQLQGKA